MKAQEINLIFKNTIVVYHKTDSVDTEIANPHKVGSLENLLYLKNWIDTVQWHLEDIIRSPEINPENLVAIKRRIDSSNQHRTDTVEKIDDYFVDALANVSANNNATLNSETPAWLLDRMSILQLKIYHFKEQIERSETSEEHKASVQNKLNVLLIQEKDMETCFDELMTDLQSGKKFMKVYRQMKMYNDPALNPVLYAKKG